VIEDCNVSLLQIANMPFSGIESNLFILKELSDMSHKSGGNLFI
jgi:hypothetical protein